MDHQRDTRHHSGFGPLNTLTTPPGGPANPPWHPSSGKPNSIAPPIPPSCHHQYPLSLLHSCAASQRSARGTPKPHFLSPGPLLQQQADKALSAKSPTLAPTSYLITTKHQDTHPNQRPPTTAQEYVRTPENPKTSFPQPRVSAPAASCTEVTPPLSLTAARPNPDVRHHRFWIPQHQMTPSSPFSYTSCLMTTQLPLQSYYIPYIQRTKK